MFPLADRMSLVSESITLAVSAKAAALKKSGVDVVGFGAGEPDFDTPTFIKEAAKAALDKGQTKYTPTPCLPELRQAIAEKFNRDNGLPYKPEQITTPSNAAGHMYSPDEMRGLAEVIAKHPNLVVFSDEIYEKLVYEGNKFVSFATLHPSLLERTLTFNCHSKSFAMTGWRMGYIGGPKAAIDAINKLQSQMNSHITSFTQVPAAVALTDPRGRDTVEQMRREFEQRGRHMWERLGSLPRITCVRPQGAFYCFPNIGAYIGRKAGGVDITDAISFANALLEQDH